MNKQGKKGMVVSPFRHFLSRCLVASLLIFYWVCFVPAGAGAAPLPALGSVMNMFPAGGSSTTITTGSSLTVYVQVYKAGVTPGGGQGANITCTLHWGQVAAFGGTWSNVIDTAMGFNTDAGNNDEYQTTISPVAGLYEYTAFCTDTTDSAVTWQSSGNGRLTVTPAMSPTVTPTPPTVTPAVTTGAATTITTTGATLNGMVNANGTSTAVTFQYGLNTAYGATVTAAQSPVSGSSATAVSSALTGLLPNTTYHFRAVGINTAGTTHGLDATFTTACLSSITVTNANDSGSGSLRQAIASVCVNGTIDFDGDYTIHLQSTLTIDKGLTLTGSGHSVTISGDSDNNGTGDVRVFWVQDTPLTILDKLNIVKGTATATADNGGGLYLVSGYLLIQNSTFSGNSATSGWGDGGGIYNANGTLSIQNSTFADNFSGHYGGAIFSHWYLSISSSTFSGNVADLGGGIYNENDLSISRSTFSGNVAEFTWGGGIYSNWGSVTLYNTLIANSATQIPNATPVECYIAGGGPIDPSGSLIEDGTCGALLSGDPLLAPLGNYGGPTQTFALLPGSPAINAGPCLSADQRGMALVGACDIGAFESQGFTLAKTGGDNQSALLNIAFANPLKVTVTANNPAEPVDNGQVTFTPPSSGARAVITGSPATISGGAASVSATANNTVGGPYNVTASATGVANNLDFSLTNLSALTDLAVTKTDGVTSATPGGSVTYIITASNAGPSNASGATVADTFPASLTATWTCVGAGGGTCTASGFGNINDTVNLPAGGSVAYTVSATISATATGTLSNTATVTASGGVTDPNPANNSATDSDTIVLPAAVTITTEIHNAAHTPVTSATLGESLHASATVTGNGLAATGSVTFTAFNNPSCSGTGTAAGTVSLVGSVAEPSQNTSLTTNGLSFRAHYNGDSNYPASDGDCVSLSTTPYPTVLTLSANTLPQDGSILIVTPSNLLVQFSLDVLHGSATDTHSAENPVNYLLVAAGVNGTFDTTACGPAGVGGLQPDDMRITVNSVSYDPTTFIAKLTVNNGTALPNGVYRLFICGTTSITNTLGITYLNNHTADSVVTFTLAVPSSQPGGNSATKLPATGFAPNVVTLLPEQPAAKAYADEGMWLEIPTLGVKQQIVGVPGPDWNVTWLGSQIGYLQGTAFPTWNGNSALTGHVTDANGKPGPFANLGTLSWGNQVIINAWEQQYIYEVRTVSLQTEPNSTSALTKHEKLPWLTLITCRGYDEKTNTYRWRAIVRAVLVSVR